MNCVPLRCSQRLEADMLGVCRAGHRCSPMYKGLEGGVGCLAQNAKTEYLWLRKGNTSPPTINWQKIP